MNPYFILIRTQLFLTQTYISMKRLLFLAAVALALGSCSLQKQTTNTSKTLGIYGAGVIQNPVLTNLTVNQRKFTSSYRSSGSQGVEYTKARLLQKL